MRYNDSCFHVIWRDGPLTQSVLITFLKVDQEMVPEVTRHQGLLSTGTAVQKSGSDSTIWPLSVLDA